MSISTRIEVEQKHIKIFQDTIKRWDGRFMAQLSLKEIQPNEDGPFVLWISFDKVSNYNKFRKDWELFSMPITELNRRTWQIKMLRRLRGELKHLGYVLEKAFKG